MMTVKNQEYSPQKKSQEIFSRFANVTENLKTTLWFKRKLPDLNEPLLEAALKSQIGSYSPVKAIGTPDNSPSKPPVSVHTSTAKLQKTLETENLVIYAVNSNTRNEFSGEELKKIFDTLFDGIDVIPFLPPIEPGSVKTQKETMTDEKRNSAKKKTYRDQSKAITNNHGAVRANVDITNIYFTEENLNRTAEILKFDDEKAQHLKKQFLNFKAEWLHLIDYANIGEKGQCPENLVLGSEEANSQMIIIEEYIKRILNKNLTAEIEVTAAIWKFHIAYEIQYTLCIPETGTNIEMKFNPFSREKPRPEYIQYLALAEKALAKNQVVENPFIKSSAVKNLFTFFKGDSTTEDNNDDSAEKMLTMDLSLCKN